MFIKICGLTDPAVARLAAEEGAQFIGILFSPLSVRKVSMKLAHEIVSSTRAGGGEAVGVFVDEDLEKMMRIIHELDLRVVQLHGEAARRACHALPHELTIIYVVDDDPLPDRLDPRKDFLLFERRDPEPRGFRFFIAGGLNAKNVEKEILLHRPHGVDLSSGVEVSLAKKEPSLIREFIHKVTAKGRFGDFGGMYVPELLVQPLKELEHALETIGLSDGFQEELAAILRTYAGRPTALTEVKRFASVIGKARIFLKREDLLHTGAHKINNAIGQCLLAKKMGKTRIIAETGAGQHGVATATACALMGLQCTVFMGAVDMERQAPNVAKMRLLGAEVRSVANGAATLKEAINEALRDWAHSYETTHYCIGSALGPHPFPKMVARFQQVIGQEAKQQIFDCLGRHPDLAIACVGGGSNAIGLFSAYLDELSVALIGVEAGGIGSKLGHHAARFQGGSPGVLHGSFTYLLQTAERQIASTYSISAGLDYPAVGPQHAALFHSGRARYEAASDSEALAAFQLLAQTEGIIPALESSHALGYVMRIAKDLGPEIVILVNLSGRGDKDLPRLFEKELKHVANR